MKNHRTLRLALFHGLLGSALLASPAFALTTAEFDSLRTKADRGNAIAQYNLGLAYADRRETIYNPAEAYAWLSLAAANGTRGKALATLTGLLTPEQLAEGQRRLALLKNSPVSPVVATASPILAVDDSAAPAPSPAAEPGQDQKKLSAELAAAWKETELLKAGLSAQLADANKRIAIAEAALASKDRQIASLQTRLSENSAAPAGASPELASLRTERDQLQASANAAATELAALRAASFKANAEQTALRDQLALATGQVSEARRAQSLAEAEAASLKVAADRAGAERLAVAAQLETVTSELAAAKAAPAPALSETGLAVLKADRDRLAETVKTLEQERDTLAARLAAATPAADTTTPPAADAAAKLAELAAAKAETDTKLEAALRSFTLQQAEIDHLQKSLASIDNERAELSSKLETARTEAQSLRLQAEAAGTATVEANTLRAQLIAARQTLSEQAASLDAANRGLADARRTVDSATADLVATRDQLRQTQAQAAASAIEAQQLKTRLALVGNLPASTAPSRPGSLAGISISLPPPAPAPAAPPVVEMPATPKMHTVSAGDSLSRISKKYYGTPTRWNDILQANKDVIRNPDSLSPGTRLRIP